MPASRTLASRRVSTFCGVLAWLCCLPLSAAAEATFLWSGPASCPSAAEARVELDRLLRKPFARIVSDSAIEVRLWRAADGTFEASVAIRTEQEHQRIRTLRDRDCSALAQAATLVAALAIDPRTHTSPPRTSQTKGPRPPGQPLTAATVSPPVPADPGVATPPTAAGAGMRAPAAVPHDGSGVTRPAAPTGSAAEAAISPAGPRVDAVVSPAAAAQPSSESTAPVPVSPRTPASPPTAAATNREPHAPGPLPLLVDAPPTTATASHETPQQPSAESTENAGISARTSSEPTARLSGPSAPWAHDGTAFLAASAGLGLGTLPALAPDIAGALGLLGVGWTGSLRAGYTPSQRAVLHDPAGVGARIALFHAAVEAGPRFQWSRLEIPIVLGLAGGWFAPEAEGARPLPKRTATWLASYLGSGLTWPWSRVLSLGLRAQLLLPFTRPWFALQSDQGETRSLYRPAPIAGRIFLDLEMRLP